MQITINPTEENPSTLRAVALMLSSIASDRDGGAPPGQTTVIEEVGEVRRTTITPETALGNDPSTAAGAEQIPPPPPLTFAQGAQNTSQNETNNSAGTSSDFGELDKNGFPWDPRIHSGSKGKNQDGSWKSLRNVDKSIVPVIEAELRARMAGGNSAPTESQPSDTPPPPPPIVQQEQTPPPPPPLETAASAPAENPDLLKQQAFKRLSGLTAEQRTEALGKVGLATPADFLKEVKVKPELAAQLIDEIVLLTGEE